MVIAYWLVGREIVEEEQSGEKRAEYGKRLIEELSVGLTDRYGKGFSAANLWLFRQFYQTYQTHKPILDTPCRELPESKSYPVGREFEQREKLYPSGGELFLPKKGRPRSGESPESKTHPSGGESLRGFLTDLSWSHYRALMRVKNESTRFFC